MSSRTSTSAWGCNQHYLGLGLLPEHRQLPHPFGCLVTYTFKQPPSSCSAILQTYLSESLSFIYPSCRSTSTSLAIPWATPPGGQGGSCWRTWRISFWSLISSSPWTFVSPSQTLTWIFVILVKICKNQVSLWCRHCSPQSHSPLHQSTRIRRHCLQNKYSVLGAPWHSECLAWQLQFYAKAIHFIPEILHQQRCC